MLHPTDLPDCAPLLNKVLDFQEQLLAFGCRTSSLTPDYFRTELGDAIFNWLQSTRSTRKLFEPIYTFAKLPQAEKDAVLADFQHDRKFVDHYDDDAFTFRLFCDGSDPNRQRVQSWLVSFYDEFSKRTGIHGSCLGNGSSASKQVWWQDFRAKNRDRITCTVCDGSMNHAVTVEHYLPKTRYPALSVHPYNLLPVCDKCNNDKGDKDPLDGRNLTSVFVPYRDSVRTSAHLEFTDSGCGQEQIALVADCPSPTSESQLQSLSMLFAIPGQWQANLHEISEIAWRRLKDYAATVSDEGVTLNKAEMPDRLNKLCKRLESDWGTMHYYYPATEWLRWAKEAKFDQLCEELAIPDSTPL